MCGAVHPGALGVTVMASSLGLEKYQREKHDACSSTSRYYPLISVNITRCLLFGKSHFLLQLLSSASTNTESALSGGAPAAIEHLAPQFCSLSESALFIRQGCLMNQASTLNTHRLTNYKQTPAPDFQRPDRVCISILFPEPLKEIAHNHVFFLLSGFLPPAPPAPASCAARPLSFFSDLCFFFFPSSRSNDTCASVEFF